MTLLPPPSTAPAPEHRTSSAEHRLLRRGILNRLDAEFGRLLTRETLEQYLDESSAELARRSSSVAHAPVFVERFARQRLRALAKNEGLVVDHQPVVLFVCQRNDGASQMAAALFRRQAGDRAVALSAGRQPSGELLVEAVHALHEIGIELLDEFPKPLTPEVEQAADIIITLDRHDRIPVLDDRHYEAWRTIDPEGGGLNAYRSLRHELTIQVERLVGRLAPPTPAASRAGFDGDLEELTAMVDRMGRDVVAMIQSAAGALEGSLPFGRSEGWRRVRDADARVDAAHLAIVNRVLEIIALRQPVAGDLRTLLALDNTVIHLERVADGLVDVAEVALAGHLPREEPMPPGLGDMLSLLEVMVGDAVADVVDRSTGSVDGIVAMERQLDDLHGGIFRWLSEGRAADHLAGIELDRVSRAIKRAGEHAVDMAEQAVFADRGQWRELRRSGPTG
ncbi:MAG: PhoU domain-containing protein [Actinomycetota bacterium]